MSRGKQHHLLFSAVSCKKFMHKTNPRMHTLCNNCHHEKKIEEAEVEVDEEAVEVEEEVVDVVAVEVRILHFAISCFLSFSMMYIPAAKLVDVR